MPGQVRRMLRGVVEGDRRAAGWLYDEYSARLYRRLRLRYPELDAEELTQDAFVACIAGGSTPLARMLEKPDDLTSKQVEHFLWNLACGIASNRRRSARRKPESPLVNEHAILDGSSERRDSERSLIGRDELQNLDRCLRFKGVRVYLYFKLRYYEGLTPEEITRATGWSRKATYKLRQALNDALQSCAEEIGIRVA